MGSGFGRRENSFHEVSCANTEIKQKFFVYKICKDARFDLLPK